MQRIALTASTSEAYSWLFTMLGDAGDEVLVPAPGYPLCTDIARFARLRARPYRLQRTADGWHPDRDQVADGLARGVRAVVAIHPHNPTGAFLRGEDQSWLLAACVGAGAALIVDEVFADFQWGAGLPTEQFRYGDSPALLFVLGGISKTLALPQLKCSWILTCGPSDLASHAMQHLEYIGDTYLSVGAVTQLLLPELLTEREWIQERIRSRLDANNALLALTTPEWRTPANSGGWWRLCPLGPATDDEAFALALLQRSHTLVHPGYLFDADQPAVAVSLITPEAAFAAGAQRLATLRREW